MSDEALIDTFKGYVKATENGVSFSCGLCATKISGLSSALGNVKAMLRTQKYRETVLHGWICPNHRRPDLLDKPRRTRTGA